MLLVVAGLFTRTLVNLQAIDPGFKTSGVLLFRVDPRLSGYAGAALVGLYDRMQNDVAALPGVQSVTLSPFSLITGRGSRATLTPPGRPDDEEIQVQIHTVAPNFLATMQIPLVLGRDLDDRDGADAPRVAVVKLYGLDPVDPISMAIASIVLVAVSAVAAYLPAHRASRTDPLVALRFE